MASDALKRVLARGVGEPQRWQLDAVSIASYADGTVVYSDPLGASTQFPDGVWMRHDFHSDQRTLYYPKRGVVLIPPSMLQRFVAAGDRQVEVA